MLEAQRSRCELFGIGSEHGDVSVGIIDSVYDPTEFGDFAEYNRIGRTVDIIDRPGQITGPHGLQIAQILSFNTHNPEYHFFQAVGKDGTCYDSHLIAALGKAMEFGEVEILNMSVGNDHIANPNKDCTHATPDCSLCEVAAETIDSGITIVAAAGNQPYTENVCCPSLEPTAISVGGAVKRCTAVETATNPLNPPGLQLPRPPNAYWVERDDDMGSDGTFCSERGCMPGESCLDNSVTEPWEKNVTFSNRKPDTLAPVHLPWSADDGIYLDEGTSFAAPHVTAGIVVGMEWATPADVRLEPAEIRAAIRATGREFEKTNRRHFSAKQFINEVRANRGLRRADFDNSDDLFDSGSGYR